MNDVNREEPSRYVAIESCDYVIDSCNQAMVTDYSDSSDLADLAGNDGLEEGPDGLDVCKVSRDRRWRAVECLDMVDQDAPGGLARAFWVPGVSAKRNRVKQYCIYSTREKA